MGPVRAYARTCRAPVATNAWPLAGLCLTTDRLELRLPTADELLELVSPSGLVRLWAGWIPGARGREVYRPRHRGVLVVARPSGPRLRRGQGDASGDAESRVRAPSMMDSGQQMKTEGEIMMDAGKAMMDTGTGRMGNG